MIEIGKRYRITMVDGDGEVQIIGTIASYEHPPVKFADVDLSQYLPTTRPGLNIARGAVINLASPRFVSAVIVEASAAPE